MTNLWGGEGVDRRAGSLGITLGAAAAAAAADAAVTEAEATSEGLPLEPGPSSTSW